MGLNTSTYVTATTDPVTGGITLQAGTYPLKGVELGLLSGRRWCFLGDSITNGSTASNFDWSFTRLANSAVGQLVVQIDYIEAGTPGDRSDQALARMDSLVSSYYIDAWCVLIGTNDAAQSVTPAVFWTNLQNIIHKAAQNGAKLVVCTVPPRGTGASAAIQNLVVAYNFLIRLNQAKFGYEIADTYAALVDTTSGLMAATYDSGDAVHPNNLGHQMMAPEVAAAMKRATKQSVSTIVNSIFAGAGLITTDPLNARASVASGSYYEQPGGTGTAPTYSMVSDTSSVLKAGRWAQMDFDAVSGGVRRLATAVSSGFSVGDKILVCMKLQIEDVSGTWIADVNATTAQIAVSLLNQSAVSIPGAGAMLSSRATGLKNTAGFYDFGPIVFPVTIPAATTQLLLWISLVLPTGKRVKMRIGELGIVNLTVLGLNSVIDDGATVINT